MQTTELAEDCLVRVRDFHRGDVHSDGDQTHSRWCCEQLEGGRILFFESLPFGLPEQDRTFLRTQHQDSRLHKNISYRPQHDQLRGFSADNDASVQKMHDIMRRYSGQVVQFLSRLLAPYASQWTLDYASFRSEQEQGRELPLHKRNDLLHLDAFPSRPTHGGRILRCFTNINPTEPRVWQTTDGFAELAEQHAQQAGLAGFAAGNGDGLQTVLQSFGRVLGFKASTSSAYDKFMLHFHDYLKENTAFQKDCPKIKLEFPPGSTWIVFTDAVPHAVLYGQYAVEQTLMVPMAGMVHPEKSPLRVLESIAGRPLTKDGAPMTANA